MGSRRRRSAGALPELTPMLAVAAAEPPHGPGWTFEPKWDGIRVLLMAVGDDIAILSRNGLDKTAQFPEIAAAATALLGRAHGALVLDGEIVAMKDGVPARFQSLQSRLHATRGVTQRRTATPARFLAFDCLLAGETALVSEPWSRRRKALERLLRGLHSPHIAIGETSPDGSGMLQRAEAGGWEGVIAKRTDAPYRPGVRSRDWLKLKLERRQEFVVGGYTRPRGARSHIGALLLGYFEGRRLIYAGHVGGGFSRASLLDMKHRLAPLARDRSPFHMPPRTNEPATWVEPRIVVEVRFNEWTDDGKLRQPIFLGVREDRKARDVSREPSMVVDAGDSRRAAGRPRGHAVTGPDVEHVAWQLDEIEKAGGSGTVDLGSEGTLDVSRLDKPFFRQPTRTKGDLMRYYARVSPVLLPAIRDRPLVLKRFPDGAGGPSFYQQKPAGRGVPAGVRIEPAADRGEPRFVGGNLITLLYTVQLGAISVDPWHARYPSLHTPDYTILDLDPGEGASFRKVVRVAQLVREELDRLGLYGIPKTSGASGMHVVVPLAAGIDEQAALILAELVATSVANAAPKIATVVRSVRSRPRGTVYVDYLQNIRGKSVAGVYAVRAVPRATVSTPLAWDEVDESLAPRAFTMDTVLDRLASKGDLWEDAMARPNTLDALLGDRPRRPRARSARVRRG